MCQYCHKIHLKNELSKNKTAISINVCPIMLAAAEKIQKNKALDCHDCGGVGTYEKITEITHCEPEESFNIRVAEYQKMK